MAGESIEQFYVDGFVANLNNAPQQMGARLAAAVDSDLAYSTPGQMFNADDILADDGEVAVTERAPDSPSSFATDQRRVGFFTAHAFGRFVGDDIDKARMLEDPTNPTMRGMMAAKARGTDDAIIAALTGAARSGATGQTSNAFPSAQQIAADNREFLHAAEASVVPGSGDLALTVGKVIKAKVMLDASELEGDRYFAVTSTQLGNLLSSTAQTSSDYNSIKALVNGEVNQWMGFSWIRTERLPVASSIRTCLAWAKPALVYRERAIKNARLQERADKSFRWYAYYELERGGVRRYDTGVVEVLCSEA